ncbi:MAG: hypothetical protein DRJ31_06250 [Candidatus Methanomethylicota archaeon]|uniref:Methyltransferase n=1 Tax=Thermoproteota archaeon TaxID=2056631 RepID=A0A497EP47_9CREN|nr:MAG: hypothetical protein DRJ31_06250 [Candidatus Verstraetearchaeota archaeon]
MGLSDVLWERARSFPKIRIGVGAGVDVNSVVKSIEALRGVADFTIVSNRGLSCDFCKVLVCDCPEEVLVDLLWSGEVDACVRGSLGARSVLECLRKRFSVSELLRVSILEFDSRPLLVAPVGVDEGFSFEEKVRLVEAGVRLCGELGFPVKRVGLVSCGRLEDVGRCEYVDESIAELELLKHKLIEKFSGLEVAHWGIVVEEAVKSSDLLVFWNGVLGNLFVRCLALLCGVRSFGAPIMGIEKVFVDTFRGRGGFIDALLLAKALALARLSK